MNRLIFNLKAGVVTLHGKVSLTILSLLISSPGLSASSGKELSDAASRRTEAIETTKKAAERLELDTKKHLEDAKKNIARNQTETVSNRGVVEAASKSQLLTHDMISSLTTLVAAAISFKILTDCKLASLDMKMVAGSGVSYIAGEILSIFQFKKYKEASELSEVKYEWSVDPNIQDEQMKSLEKAKGIYSEAKKAADKKMKLQLIAAGGYTAAAMWALGKSVYLKGQKKSCLAAALANGAKPDPTGTTQFACTTTAALASEIDWVGMPTGSFGPPSKVTCATISQSAAELTKTDAICGSAICTKYVVSYAKEFGQCDPEAGSQVFGNHDHLLNSIIDLISFNQSADEKFSKRSLEELRAISISGLSDGFVSYYQDPAYRSYRGLSPLNHTYQMQGSKSAIRELSALNTAYNLFFPEASATALIPGLNLGAAVVGVAGSMYASQKLGIDSTISTPEKRIIAWTGLAALSAATVVVTKGISNKMKSNVDKIDNAIEIGERFSSSRKPSKSLNSKLPGGSPSTSSELVGLSSGELLANVSENTFQCDSSVTINCETIAGKVKEEKGNEGFDFGSNFATISSLNNSIAKSVVNRSPLTAESLAGINSFDGKKLSALRQRLKNRIKKYDLKFKKENPGRPSILSSANSFGLRMKAPLSNEYLAATDKNNFTKSLLDYTTAGYLKKKALVKKGIKSQPIKTPIQKNVKVSIPNFPSFNSELFELDNLEEAAMDKDLIVLSDLREDLLKKGSDISIAPGSDEINSRSDESIFKQISHRYIRSGLPRLFMLRE